MNERNNSPDCERAPDLLAFLYNEVDEHEACDFKLHLEECLSCRAELASFGAVRESITTWRDEALSGFVSSPVVSRAGRKSALAAFRQFFDLSPLWLRGATALAAVTVCVLVGMATVNRNDNHVSSNQGNSQAVYTRQDVNRIVQEALAKQENAKLPVESASSIATVKPSRPKSSRSAPATQLAKSRRPLSKAEREQLAAELRLLSTQDESTINLIGDRINQ